MREEEAYKKGRCLATSIQDCFLVVTVNSEPIGRERRYIKRMKAQIMLWIYNYDKIDVCYLWYSVVRVKSIGIEGNRTDKIDWISSDSDLRIIGLMWLGTMKKFGRKFEETFEKYVIKSPTGSVSRSRKVGRSDVRWFSRVLTKVCAVL